MRADEIAQLLVAGLGQQATGNTDVGYHIGTVQSWDELTGLNSILINGNTFANLKVLSTSNTIMISAGDTVLIMRLQTQYFVLGRIQAPGAGAALRISAGDVDDLVNLPPLSSSFQDLPGSVGPTVTDVFVGSARRCMVFMSTDIYADSLIAYASFQVSGASNIAPTAANDRRTLKFGFNSAVSGYSTVTKIVLLNASDGLNQGLNTFTMKYRNTSGNTCSYSNRKLVIFPY